MADNLKATITEICSEILKELDENKPKLKWIMTGKQKQQSARNEELSRERM